MLLDGYLQQSCEYITLKRHMKTNVLASAYISGTSPPTLDCRLMETPWLSRVQTVGYMKKWLQQNDFMDNHTVTLILVLLRKRPQKAHIWIAVPDTVASLPKYFDRLIVWTHYPSFRAVQSMADPAVQIVIKAQTNALLCPVACEFWQWKPSLR